MRIYINIIVNPPRLSSTNPLFYFQASTTHHILHVTQESRSHHVFPQKSTPILMTRWIHLNHLPGVARRPRHAPPGGGGDSGEEDLGGECFFFSPLGLGFFVPSFEFLHRKSASQDYLVKLPKTSRSWFNISSGGPFRQVDTLKYLSPGTGNALGPIPKPGVCSRFKATDSKKHPIFSKSITAIH